MSVIVSSATYDQRLQPLHCSRLAGYVSYRLTAVFRMPLPTVCAADKRTFASKSPGCLRRCRNELAMLLMNAAH